QKTKWRARVIHHSLAEDRYSARSGSCTVSKNSSATEFEGSEKKSPPRRAGLHASAQSVHLFRRKRPGIRGHRRWLPHPRIRGWASVLLHPAPRGEHCRLFLLRNL